MNSRCFKLKELAEFLGGEVEGNDDVEINGVAGIREAKTGQITFLANPKYETYLSSTDASAVIAPPRLSCDKPLIHIENPYFAYLKVLSLFAEDTASRYPRVIHDTCIIGHDVSFGPNVSVGPFAQICNGVTIGPNSTILLGVFIGDGVTIGEDCVIYPNVTIREGAEIGDRVILHPGAVIGADGFGYAKEGTTHHKVPQIGRVVLEDDVEIGANSTVDRATTGETRVKRGSKVDNLVQIAHNVVVGENSIIAAQVGISGSTELGRNVVLGGQAGLAGHITIGDGVVMGGRAGATKSIPANTRVSGYPAREHTRARRVYAVTAQLPELLKRVRNLEKKLGRLEGGESVDPTTEDN